MRIILAILALLCAVAHADPPCNLDVSTNALLQPGSDYLPATSNGAPYVENLGVRIYNLFTPALAGLASNTIPFMPALPIPYNPDTPCPRGSGCKPCATLTHAQAPYGCYCPLQMIVRFSPDESWLPATNEAQYDRCGLPAAEWQKPNVFAKPFKYYLNARLPRVTSEKYVINIFVGGYGSNFCGSFAYGDVAAGDPEGRVVSVDFLFQPDSAYAGVGTVTQQVAMSNLVSAIRMAINVLTSGEGVFAEWNGLFTNANPDLIVGGWSLGGAATILNDLGYPSASITSWKQCLRDGTCKGKRWFDMPVDATESILNTTALKKYNNSALSFGSDSLRLIQSYPLFYATQNLFDNYLVTGDGTLHTVLVHQVFCPLSMFSSI